MQLKDIVDSWPEDLPGDLVQLMDHPYEELAKDPRAKALRSMAVDLVHSFERSPVNTARDALTLLEKHHLPVRKDMWTIVALSESRERVYVRSTGGMRLLHTVSRKVPTPAELAEKVPLPPQGIYLAMRGGLPSDADSDDVDRLRNLSSTGVLADILYWDVRQSPAAFYSCRAGVISLGSSGLSTFEEGRLDLW